MRGSLRLSTLARQSRGNALIEFAFVLPMLAALLFGMVAYGEYFLIAHGAQQLANDAARATVAGLTAAERSTLARERVTAGAGTLALVRTDWVSTDVSESGNNVTVTVSVDASAVPLLGTRLIPMPSSMIRRTAIAHPGGAL